MRKTAKTTAIRAAERLQKHADTLDSVFCIMIKDNRVAVEMHIEARDLGDALYGMAKGDEKIWKIITQVAIQLAKDEVEE